MSQSVDNAAASSSAVAAVVPEPQPTRAVSDVLARFGLQDPSLLAAVLEAVSHDAPDNDLRNLKETLAAPESEEAPTASEAGQSATTPEPPIAVVVPHPSPSQRRAARMMPDNADFTPVQKVAKPSWAKTLPSPVSSCSRFSCFPVANLFLPLCSVPSVAKRGSSATSSRAANAPVAKSRTSPVTSPMRSESWASTSRFKKRPGSLAKGRVRRRSPRSPFARSRSRPHRCVVGRPSHPIRPITRVAGSRRDRRGRRRSARSLKRLLKKW